MEKMTLDRTFRIAFRALLLGALIGWFVPLKQRVVAAIMAFGAGVLISALSFELADLDAEMAALRARGVRFDEYDLPGLKTHDGVCVLGGERAAWFHDPEGNILCIHQDA